MRKGEKLKVDFEDLPQFMVEEELPAKGTKRAERWEGEWEPCAGEAVFNGAALKGLKSC